MAERADNLELCDPERKEIAFLSRKLLDLNKQLMESEKGKTRFLSLVANKLNNPMTALLGLIPHLASQSGEKRETILALAEQEALHLDFHIQNLVAAAEIENGELKLSYALIDPEELIDDVIKALKYWMHEKNVQIRIDNRMNEKIVTDPQKLHLILKNLVANACTYGNADESVDIRIERRNEQLAIEVKNRGEGPHVEYKPQVFTRFSQASGGVHGLGIGLSIVRGLCELLGGDVDYTADGKSVMFTVTLPLNAELPNSEACGSNEFLFESFDDAIEL